MPQTDESADLIGNICRELIGSRPGVDELAKAAQRARNDPPGLRRSLSALRDSGERLKKTAVRSTFHANDFVKIPLQDDSDCGVRLHVWSPRHRADRKNPDPHGHRWDFASWVVTGALDETRYEKAQAGEPFERHDYGRRPDGSYYLRPAEPVRLAPVHRAERRTGEVYGCHRSVLHTAVPVDVGLAASLVLRGPRSREATRVYLPPGASVPDEEQPLSVDELRLLLDDVIKAIP